MVLAVDSENGLVHMIMGGEVYLGDPTTDAVLDDRAPARSPDRGAYPLAIRHHARSWTARRRTRAATANRDRARQPVHPHDRAVRQGLAGGHERGAQVSIAFPIEMNMRHGIPPIIKMQQLGMEPSLSVDVECTMTADFFTQMRVAMNMQRMVVNQMILEQETPDEDRSGGLTPLTAQSVADPDAGIPPLLTTRDVLRYATMNGAKALRLDGKVGSLTPGKEADIIILDATKINVAPLNQVPGAVVSLMDRTNVETVIVAGKVRKWKGQLLDVDLDRLRSQLEASRDYIFSEAGIPQNLFAASKAG